MVNKSDEQQSDKQRDALLPCPCCGSEARFEKVQHEILDPNFGAEYVECSNRLCGVTTRLVFPVKDDVRRELAEVWNRRSVAPSAGGSTFIDARIAYIEGRARRGEPSPTREELAAFYDGFHAVVHSATLSINELAELCWPAVRSWLNKAERLAMNPPKPEYKTILEADADRARKLLDDIEALVGRPVEPHRSGGPK